MWMAATSITALCHNIKKPIHSHYLLDTLPFPSLSWHTAVLALPSARFYLFLYHPFSYTFPTHSRFLSLLLLDLLSLSTHSVKHLSATLHSDTAESTGSSLTLCSTVRRHYTGCFFGESVCMFCNIALHNNVHSFLIIWSRLRSIRVKFSTKCCFEPKLRANTMSSFV